MGLMRNAVGMMKGKKKDVETQPEREPTIEETYVVGEEEEQPSILDLFAQWSAERIKQDKSRAKLAEVE